MKLATLSIASLTLLFAGCVNSGELEVDYEGGSDETPIIIDTDDREPASESPTPGATNESPTDETPTTQNPNIPECAEGQDFCQGACLDVLTNDAHCGGCDNVCGEGLICVAGECGCEQGDYCDGACVDTSTDSAHCGTCGNACSGGAVCDAGACAQLGEVNGVLVASNNARAQGADCGVYGQFAPVPPLELDPDLNEAAQAHALDMAENNFFSHTGSDGSNFATRIGRTDFSGQPIGENIASGQRSAEQVVAGWIDSDGHCRNIMNPSATKLGVGYTPGGRLGTLWVQVFAR